MAWFLLLFPVVLILAYPFVQDYLHAAALLARIADPGATSWIARHDAHPVTAVTTMAFDNNGTRVEGQVFRPLGIDSAAMVLLAWRLQPKPYDAAVRLAQALAVTGYSVLLPDFSHAAELGADQASAELVARAAATLARDLGVSKVGILAPASLSGAAGFAANTPEGSRYIAWVVSGEPIASAMENPQGFSQLSVRDRLALVHWLSLLIHEARNTPSSRRAELPAASWVMTSYAESQYIPW